jgi:hypothetical protein
MSMLAFVPGLTLPCLFGIVWAEVGYANDQYVLRDYYTDVLGRSEQKVTLLSCQLTLPIQLKSKY